MRVGELKKLLEKFSDDDYIIARGRVAEGSRFEYEVDHDIIEVKNIDRNSCRAVVINLKEDNSVEVRGNNG